MPKFGPWLPDQSQYNEAICADANGVVGPSSSGFRPWQIFVNIATAIGARPQGAISVRGLTGTIYNFCGDISKLYKMATTGLSWADVSRTVGGAYVTSPDGWWNFALFGDYVIAVNQADATQSFQLSASTNFAALAGSPPKGAFISVCRDFVGIGRVSTAYNRHQWSAINNHADYVPSATTMSDYQDFPDSGSIMGEVGGEYWIIFLERSIQRMAFQGPPTIFRADKIAQNIGCQIEGSIAAYENLIFFKSHDGFYMIRGGSELVAIGSEKIDRWADSNIDYSYKWRCSSAIDPARKLYLFSFPSTGASSGTPDYILTYHWPSGDWTRIPQAHTFLYTAATQTTYTIDGLDALSSTGDAMTIPWDSLFYAGSGNLVLSGFDTSFRSGFFTGANSVAVIDTGFFSLSGEGKALLRSARPLVEGTSVTLTVTPIYADRQQDAPTTGSAVTVNANGVAPMRTNARYHKLRLTIAAGGTWVCTTGYGDDVKGSKMGKR